MKEKMPSKRFSAPKERNGPTLSGRGEKSSYWHRESKESEDRSLAAIGRGEGGGKTYSVHTLILRDIPA